jgi:hypothetical protein
MLRLVLDLFVTLQNKVRYYKNKKLTLTSRINFNLFKSDS